MKLHHSVCFSLALKRWIRFYLAFYVSSCLCRFIIFLPRNVFDHSCCVLLLSPPPVCSHSSRVSIGCGGRGGEGCGDRRASQRAPVPFINIRISIAARRLKSQLRTLSGSPCEQKQKGPNLNVKPYLSLSHWAHLFTNRYFSLWLHEVIFLSKEMAHKNKWEEHLLSLPLRPWCFAICVKRLF